MSLKQSISLLEYLGYDPEYPNARRYAVDAISAKVTNNKNKYTEKELEKAARSLSFRPVTINHPDIQRQPYQGYLPFPQNSTLRAEYVPDKKAVRTVLRISDNSIIDRIDKGKITHVSIEAEAIDNCNTNFCERNNLIFTGLSLVDSIMPGDPDAILQKAETLKEKLIDLPLSELIMENSGAGQNAPASDNNSTDQTQEEQQQFQAQQDQEQQEKEREQYQRQQAQQMEAGAQGSAANRNTAREQQLQTASSTTTDTAATNTTTTTNNNNNNTNNKNKNQANTRGEAKVSTSVNGNDLNINLKLDYPSTGGGGANTNRINPERPTGSKANLPSTSAEAWRTDAKQRYNKIAELLKRSGEAVLAGDNPDAIAKLWRTDMIHIPPGLAANLRNVASIQAIPQGADTVYLFTISTPEYVEVAFSTVTENAEEADAASTIARIPVGVKIKSVKQTISWKAQRFITGDIIAEIDRGFQTSAILSEDTEVIGALDAVANADWAATIYGDGTVGTVGAITAGMTFTEDRMLEAITHIQKQAYATNNLTLVMHPKQLGDLVKRDAFKNASISGDEGAFNREGTVLSRYGISIRVSTKVSSAADGAAGATTYKSYVVTNGVTVGMGIAEELETETFRDIRKMVTVIRSIHTLGAKVLLPKTGVKIITA